VAREEARMKWLIIGGIGAIATLAGWSYYALTRSTSIVNTGKKSDQEVFQRLHEMRDWSGD
jgi:predicted negative regulator of RcsB-dependent stress response